MINDSLVVTCEDPKKGMVEYTISSLILDKSTLDLFWRKASRYPTLFSREIKSNFKAFLSLLVDEDSAGKIYSKGVFWRIDTPEEPLIGVFYMTDLELGVNALVHFSFLDGRIRGRVPLAKAMIAKVFNDFPVARLSAELPAFVNARALKFVQELGFHKEGVKRKAAKFNDSLFHVHLFGILREEVSNGS